MGDISSLAAILAELSKATGKLFDARLFSSRLRIQKSIYLLKTLGTKEVIDYHFSYYVRGPYSPDLAKDYYLLQSSQVPFYEVKIPATSLQMITDCVGRGDAFLEAVATLHSISKIRKSNDKSEVIGVALSFKPELSPNYDEAWDFVKATGLL